MWHLKGRPVTSTIKKGAVLRSRLAQRPSRHALGCAPVSADSLSVCCEPVTVQSGNRIRASDNTSEGMKHVGSRKRCIDISLFA